MELKNEAWRGIDVAYLVCENDRVLQPETQLKYLERLTEQGLSPRETRCDSAHSPYLSQPMTVAKWLDELNSEVR